MARKLFPNSPPPMRKVAPGSGAKLPPNPDGMNEQRAYWAFNALLRFQSDTGTDPEDALADLLANLLHWCDRNKTDFDNELRKARAHYAAETDPKGGW